MIDVEHCNGTTIELEQSSNNIRLLLLININNIVYIVHIMHIDQCQEIETTAIRIVRPQDAKLSIDPSATNVLLAV